MFWKRNEGQPTIAISPSQHELPQWSVDSSADGMLHVQPAGPTLTHDEIAAMIRELRDRYCATACSEVLFDLSRVETIEPQWTLVLALLIAFARTVTARCRLVGLHGQPAAVIELYRRNRDVASLVQPFHNAA